MALDQGLSRFACCLQTSAEFEEGLGSEHRSKYTRYKAGNLAEIEHILDEIYSDIKRQDRQRREQDRQRREQDRIDAAEKERKKRQEQLACAERRRTKFICILVCTIVAFLIAYAWSQGWISGKGFALIIPTIMLVGGWYEFNEQQKKNRELSRAIDERNEREAEAKERYRIYEEKYQREGRALKKRVLDELRAIARGEKRGFDPQALNAAKELRARQGEHPETLRAWAPVMDDLKGEILDPKALQNRIDDLLYPETLEDVEALKKRVRDNLEKLAHGERLSPEALEAAKTLNEIKARDTRRKREEKEAEDLERRLEKEKDKKFRASMDEMAWNSVRNSRRSYGLSETALDGKSLDEAASWVRILRLHRQFEHLPEEERTARVIQEFQKESDQAREEIRRRAEREE